MKICIYGAGAIGGYMAVMMKRSGADVSLVARGAHLAAMKEKGLTLKIGDETFTEHMPATNDPRELGPQDYVIIGLKAHQAWESAEHMRPLFGPSTAVVTAQNGVPWWYFYGLGEQYAASAARKRRSRGPPVERDRPGARDRLHRLSRHRDHRAGRDPAHLRQSVRARRAEPATVRRGWRSLPTSWRPAASSRASMTTFATTSGSSSGAISASTRSPRSHRRRSTSSRPTPARGCSPAT